MQVLYLGGDLSRRSALCSAPKRGIIQEMWSRHSLRQIGRQVFIHRNTGRHRFQQFNFHRTLRSLDATDQPFIERAGKIQSQRMDGHIITSTTQLQPGRSLAQRPDSVNLATKREGATTAPSPS
jgi:hypothetical protein